MGIPTGGSATSGNTIKVDITANVESAVPKSNVEPGKSLKSLRTYQVGVVYKDIYGRETPVLTNEEATFTVQKELSNKENRIVADINNNPPNWADSYKFFIKETSNEYYNACMDRWYDSEDGNIWLSFPSAERNKIQEDTFLILKKEAASDSAVLKKGKYKVIDIKNEAPDFIKTDYELYGSMTLDVNSAHPNNTEIVIDWDTATKGWDDSPFFDAVLTGDIDQDGTAGNPISESTNSAGFIGWPLKDVVIDLSITGSRTGWLDVTNIRKDTDAKIFLSKPLKGNSSSNSGGILSVLPSGDGDATVKIAKKVVKNKSEFDGRFFVKIKRDPVVDDHIRAIGNPSPSFVVKNSVPQYYLTTPKSGSNSSFWNSIGEIIFIDKASRANVGTGGGTGSAGPYDEDDGYGIIGSGTGARVGSAKSSLRCTMELSLSKIKDGEQEGFSTADNTQAYQEFLQSMSTVGTKFRWKEDPFQHIYKVTTVYNSQDGNTNGTGIYNYSSKSKHKDEKDNKTVRLYIKFKTTGWRLNDDQASSGTYEFFEDEKDKYPFNYLNQYDVDTSEGTAYPTSGGVDIPEWNPTKKGYGTYGGSVAWQLNTASNDFDDIEVTSSFPASTDEDEFRNTMEIVDIGTGSEEPVFTENPAIWETEPKEDIGLDIYYEASQAYPIQLTEKTNELFIPFGSLIESKDIITAPLVSGVQKDLQLYFPPESYVETWSPTNNGGDCILVNIRASELGIYDTQKAISEAEATEVADVTLNSNVMDLSQANANILAGYKITGPGVPYGTEVITVAGTTVTMSDNAQSNETNETYQFVDPNNATLNPIPVGNSAFFNIFGPGYLHLNNLFVGKELRFIRQDGGYVTAKIKHLTGWKTSNTNINGNNPAYNGDNDILLIKLDRDITKGKIRLPYFNCWSFGNGVESNRVRDDFNAVMLDKGVKASTVLATPYEEEKRSSGLIYSGIYNTNSGVNNLNQFIAGEKITKDVPPSYGSIQKLKARDTNLVAFCEDKVLKIIAYKDALYNADGKPDLISSNNVLGDITTFSGEYGISQNPESFAEESFRMYFTDKQRGKVLRLSQDGLTPISDIGMKDWFGDNLKGYEYLIGSFDDKKQEYNISLRRDLDPFFDNDPKTVSFSEGIKGWSSFKSFHPQSGLSINMNYYTFEKGKIWKHHSNQTRNNFYGNQYDSYIDVLFNQESGSVKSFGSINYEGSQSKISKDLTDPNYYNNEEKYGWYIESGQTDLQEAGTMEFKNKEGKWFSYMKGNPVYGVNDLNSKEFSFQGIDVVSSSSTTGVVTGCTDPNAVNYDPAANTDDGSCIVCSLLDITYQAVMGVDSISITPSNTAEDLPWNMFVIDSNGQQLTGTNTPNPGNVTSVFSGLNPGTYTLHIHTNNACEHTRQLVIAAVPVPGCTNPLAVNYDPNATVDDGSCILPPPTVIYGCTDPTAANYNPLATQDDGSCQYAPPNMIQVSVEDLGDND